MNLWSKISQLWKPAHPSEQHNPLLQAINQELSELEHNKTSCTTLLEELRLKKNLAQEQLQQMRQQIQEQESFAVRAIKSENDELALALANKVDQLETIYQSLYSMNEGYVNAIQTLTNSIEKVDKEIEQVKTKYQIIEELTIVSPEKAPQQVQYLDNAEQVITRIEAHKAKHQQQVETLKQFTSGINKDMFFEKLSHANESDKASIVSLLIRKIVQKKQAEKNNPSNSNNT